MNAIDLPLGDPPHPANATKALARTSPAISRPAHALYNNHPQHLGILACLRG